MELPKNEITDLGDSLIDYIQSQYSIELSSDEIEVINKYICIYRESELNRTLNENSIKDTDFGLLTQLLITMPYLIDKYNNYDEDEKIFFDFRELTKLASLGHQLFLSKLEEEEFSVEQTQFDLTSGEGLESFYNELENGNAVQAVRLIQIIPIELLRNSGFTLKVLTVLCSKLQITSSNISYPARRVAILNKLIQRDISRRYLIPTIDEIIDSVESVSTEFIEDVLKELNTEESLSAIKSILTKIGFTDFENKPVFPDQDSVLSDKSWEYIYPGFVHFPYPQEIGYFNGMLKSTGIGNISRDSQHNITWALPSDLHIVKIEEVETDTIPESNDYSTHRCFRLNLASTKVSNSTEVLIGEGLHKETKVLIFKFEDSEPVCVPFSLDNHSPLLKSLSDVNEITGRYTNLWWFISVINMRYD